eukprot:3858853-Prymnesium_polylepis.1
MGTQLASDSPPDSPSCAGPWKCAPFESDVQLAVQRDGEGEGEVGIAAATCAASGQRVHAGCSAGCMGARN